MYEYSTMCNRLGEMKPTHYSLVAAACAVKMHPHARMLALTDTWRVCETAILFLRSNLLKQPHLPTIAQLKIQIEKTPEFDCGHDAPVPYLASRSLDLIRLALESVQTRETRPAEKAIGLMLDYLGDFDLTRVECVDLSDCTQGSLVKAEENSQLILLDALSSSEYNAEQIVELFNAETGRTARAIYGLIPMHCYHYVKTYRYLESEVNTRLDS